MTDKFKIPDGLIPGTPEFDLWAWTGRIATAEEIHAQRTKGVLDRQKRKAEYERKREAGKAAFKRSLLFQAKVKA